MRNMDNELLLQLYQRYRRELYLYIYSLCRNHSMVEDILHDTFLKAILSLPDYHTNMQAWLYVVARNLCFNSLKKNRKMVLTEQVQDLQDNRQIRENLLDAFVVKEQKQQLYEALFKLPEQKREVLQSDYLWLCGNYE